MLEIVEFDRAAPVHPTLDAALAAARVKSSTRSLNSSARSRLAPWAEPSITVSLAPGISSASSFDFQTGTRMSCSPPITCVGT